LNKTIISVIKAEKIKPLKDLAQKVLGPLEETGNGILFFLPIDEVVGLKAEID